MSGLQYATHFIPRLFGVSYDKILSFDVEHEWRAFLSLSETFMRDIYGAIKIFMIHLNHINNFYTQTWNHV